MPNTPIAVHVPDLCRECGRPGTVTLQQTLKGKSIALHWCCTKCQAEWPVVRAEQEPPPAA